MNWWISNDPAPQIVHSTRRDPGGALTAWRKVKLERGLLRHPISRVRVDACRELLLLAASNQDECWEMLSDTERAQLTALGCPWCSAAEIAAARRKTVERGAAWWCRRYRAIDERRILTGINNTIMRTEFCRFWE